MPIGDVIRCPSYSWLEVLCAPQPSCPPSLPPTISLPRARPHRPPQHCNPILLRPTLPPSPTEHNVRPALSAESQRAQSLDIDLTVDGNGFQLGGRLSGDKGASGAWVGASASRRHDPGRSDSKQRWSVPRFQAEPWSSAGLGTDGGAHLAHAAVSRFRGLLLGERSVREGHPARHLGQPNQGRATHERDPEDQDEPPTRAHGQTRLGSGRLGLASVLIASPASTSTSARAGTPAIRSPSGYAHTVRPRAVAPPASAPAQGRLAYPSITTNALGALAVPLCSAVTSTLNSGNGVVACSRPLRSLRIASCPTLVNSWATLGRIQTT